MNKLLSTALLAAAAAFSATATATATATAWAAQTVLIVVGNDKMEITMPDSDNEAVDLDELLSTPRRD